MSEGPEGPGATSDLTALYSNVHLLVRLGAVNLRELQGRALVKCPSRRSWTLALGFVIVMGLVMGLVTWGIWDTWHPPLLAFGPYVALVVLLLIYGAALLFLMGFNHGIEPSNEGVIFYSPKLLRLWMTERFLIPWELLREPHLVGPTDVSFDWGLGLFPWPLIQARIVLTDSRYPYPDQIPDDLRRELRT
jgi:hypothetical protein